MNGGQHEHGRPRSAAAAETDDGATVAPVGSDATPAASAVGPVGPAPVSPVGSDAVPSASAVPAASAVEHDDAVLSVVSGAPTEQELAALTAVVVALQGAAGTDEAPDRGRSWLRRTMLRLGPTPGPGSWRRSVR